MSAADQSLPRAVIEAAVNAVASGGQALRQLADALAADPAALAAGAPPVAGRLAAELIARGSVTLAIPACTVCGGPASRCSAVTAAGCASGAVPGRWQGPAPPAARSSRPPGSTRTARRCARSAAAGMTRAATANAQRAGRPRPSRCAAGTASRASAPAATSYQKPPAANASSGAPAPTRRPASRYAPRARRGPPPPARAAGTTGRRRPAGRKDRFATRATARPCTTGGHAHGAGSSAGWSLRPARALTPAPIAPGSRSSAPAPAAAPKTSSTRRGAAPRARCAGGPGSCWPIRRHRPAGPGQRGGGDHGHPPASRRLELAAARRRRGTACRRRRRAGAADP